MSQAEREQEQERAQQTESEGYEKNQLLFTTLQAASGNSAEGGFLFSTMRKRHS